MTAAEQLLKAAGDVILHQIKVKQPLFLVEIEPADLQPEAILGHLARIGRWGWRPEYKAAAAWAAVQLASRSDAEDLQDEGGFRGLFFRELGREFSLNDWQDTYGYHIRQFLAVTFPSVELPEPGPWHLVGAVYRHAGIPAVLKASYAQFVSNMLRGELSFSFNEYQKNLNAFPSQVARQFLESRAGYEFTRDLARQVARVYQGSITSVALPAWSSRLVDAVVNSLRESGASARKLKVPKGFAKPYLCLDAETYSLRILFDSRGVREKFYWNDARPVLYPFQEVKGTNPPEFRSGVTSTSEPINPWWTPAHGGWALFRVDDGALVTNGSPSDERSVGVGDYYLVTDKVAVVPEAVVQDSQVALDVEGLDEPVWDYWILRVSLRPGSSIPALGLRIDGALPKPELEWIRPGRFRTNWGVGIFVDQLPGVRLKPWNSALASEFTLTLEDGDGEMEIAVPGDGEVKSLPARCPDSGYLAVRRRNLSREIVGRLGFGAIPPGCHIYPPTDVLRTDDTAQIALELPSGASVEWSVPVSRTAPNVYEIAAHERRLEGVLRFESCSVPFNLRLPRAGVAVELDGKDQPVLWTEFANRNYALRMELPAGAASTLFVAGEETLYPLLNQPSNARAWVQKVPLVHFRDAVLVCPSWAGELILRLRTRDSDLSDINTGRYLLSAESLARELLSLPTPSAIFQIPALGDLLSKYRNLVAQPSTDELPIPSENIPAELSKYLGRLRYLASVLDGRSPQKAVTGSSDIEDLDPLGIWLEKAQGCARAGLSDIEINEPPPYDLIAALPVLRWVQQITALIEELRQNSALPLMVGDFRLSFGSGMTAGQSALCGRQGGMALWHAVNSYRLSLKDQMPRERDLVVQLRRLETIISDPANDLVVRALAQAFRFMNYYRLGRRAMLDTAPFVSWPPLLGPLRTTLNALRAERTGQLIESVWPPLGVGLAEISPTAQDTELERRLGRPSLAPTNEFKNEIVNQ
jgi:hypothetical protein